jgi:hypothetical protein
MAALSTRHSHAARGADIGGRWSTAVADHRFGVRFGVVPHGEDAAGPLHQGARHRDAQLLDRPPTCASRRSVCWTGAHPWDGASTTWSAVGTWTVGAAAPKSSSWTDPDVLAESPARRKTIRVGAPEASVATSKVMVSG